MRESFKYLQVEQQGRVLIVRLDNPPLNFLTTAVMNELNQLLGELKRRGNVGAVILTSAIDGIFLTHFDVAEIKRMAADIPFAVPHVVTNAFAKAESLLGRIPGMRKLLAFTPAAGVSAMNLFHEVTARMRSMDKVFIAAINGSAMGGGCELTWACDLRVMAEGTLESGAMIGQPEIYIGLIPGGGGTQMLARSVGISRAMELCLDGLLLTPREALHLGLLHRVVPGADMLDEALVLARRMARRAPSAVSAIKRFVYQASAMSFNHGMNVEKACFMSAASQLGTRQAMNMYGRFVEELTASGHALKVSDLQEWSAGTAIDFSRRPR
ncbi:MAG: enoyl-CoA hydratase/isomerase family protein [Aquabacterium sp.]